MYKNTAPRKPMLIGLSNKESDKYRNEESALWNCLFFLQFISTCMCVPKIRLSAKRFIHPKFIFVRANI